MARSTGSASLSRRLLFAALYFSEGAPIGYLWWAMPARLKDAGLPDDQIAALIATLALPWAFKFLWAPAIDALRGRFWGYRCWITLAQVMMGLTLLPFAFAPLNSLLDWVGLLLIAHAFSAATQDVGIDALAIASVEEEERGRVTAWMQGGMLLGRAIFGGLALKAEAWIGAENVVVTLLGCIWFSMIVVWAAPAAAATDEHTGRGVVHRFARALTVTLARRSTWVGLVIAATAGAGFEATCGLIGPFLKSRGVASGDVGLFLAIPAIAGLVLGAVIGGWAADRVERRRLVAWSVIGIAAAVGVLWMADVSLARSALSDVTVTDTLTLAHLMLMAAAIPVYIGAGTLTASSYALFMDLTEPSAGGTSFSAFMGATNLCESWAVALVGVLLARNVDYSVAFVVAAVASLVALVALRVLRMPAHLDEGGSVRAEETSTRSVGSRSR
ncbi:MAG: MFS transporter [Phycisphaerales bacterium]|nr:MFS transporter [Phycisphaerales bacterium]